MPIILLALGFLMLTLGLGVIVLALVFWRRGTGTLLAFGAFAFLYGVALLFRSTVVHPLLGMSADAANAVYSVANYWLPIPALLYTERIRGRGWRGSLHLMWQAWIPLAIVLTVSDLVLHRAGAFRSYYLVVTILMQGTILAHILQTPTTPFRGHRVRRIGAAVFVVAIIYDGLAGVFWPSVPITLEPFGLTIFIASLGFVTVGQFFASERELAVVEHEMKTARDIQEAILPPSGIVLNGLRIAARYLPMRGIAGDLYDFHVIDDHRVGVLVADVTGHGVPAALIASMVKVAFSAQRASASRPADVLSGMNQALCGNLTAQFVTAAYVYFDTEIGELRYSVAGHPSPLLWRAGGNVPVELADGRGIFLGFDPTASYEARDMRLTLGDRVLIYTDGLLEAQNAAGAFFGETKWTETLAPTADVLPDHFVLSLVDRLRDWSGRHGAGVHFDDDLTLVVVEVHGSSLS